MKAIVKKLIGVKTPEEEKAEREKAVKEWYEAHCREVFHPDALKVAEAVERLANNVKARRK